MSFANPAPESESARTTRSDGGPAAHEDLTIAEQLELMRAPDEHRPGEECFLLSNGEKHWISDNDTKRFIASHGAEHSSDYLMTNGANWQDAFFHTGRIHSNTLGRL